jgi:hypothetical protein
MTVRLKQTDILWHWTPPAKHFWDKWSLKDFHHSCSWEFRNLSLRP